MNDLADVPDGFALVCYVCRWRPNPDVTAGVLAAHFDTEEGHEPGRIRLELVVLCPRCDEPMPLDYTRGLIDVFHCGRCHRQRSIRRGRAPS